jgi:CsoR family transcriptional regulator, copper-sensing transcriptional repressor
MFASWHSFRPVASNDKHEWVDKKMLLDRAKKVEGQATALRRMVDEDRHCSDILQQVAALNSAAQRLAVLLLEEHIEVRCRDGVAGNDVAEETGGLIRRVLKI